MNDFVRNFIICVLISLSLTGCNTIHLHSLPDKYSEPGSLRQASYQTEWVLEDFIEISVWTKDEKNSLEVLDFVAANEAHEKGFSYVTMEFDKHYSLGDEVCFHCSAVRLRLNLMEYRLSNIALDSSSRKAVDIITSLSEKYTW